MRLMVGTSYLLSVIIGMFTEEYSTKSNGNPLHRVDSKSRGSDDIL